MSTILRAQMTLIGASITSAMRTSAANAAAAADITGGGAAFYAEIGDTSGIKWSGSFGTTPPTASTAMPIASVSKPLYAAYAAHTMALGSSDYPFFSFTSGYDAMNGQQCQATSTETVDSCLVTIGTGGFSYDTLNPVHVGKYAYDGGHFQHHADKILIPSLASDTRSGLATAYRALFGLATADLVFSQPLIAGGITATANGIRTVILQIMNGTLNIKSLLNPHDTTYPPVNASTYFTDGSVVSSPAPSNEPWKYQWGFWVEPGSNYYWASGKFGFSFWISSDFKRYGIIARNVSDAGGEMGTISITTGKNIRSAYLTGRFS